MSINLAAIKHRTERGSAGSIVQSHLLGNVDPALPRSVLCLYGLLRDFDAIAGLQFGVLHGSRLDLLDREGNRHETAIRTFA